MVVEDQPTEQPHQNGATHEHDDTTHRRQDSSAQSLKRRGSIDRDAQEMVIDSLRVQIQDLFSQVSQLNNKLVKSYDRVSDLEDDLHVASANVRASSLKISQLELERTQHLAALNTGLLVEKSHVTAELSRLMEKATEEAAQRGQAESARMAIEKDLDDLSASLFDQANSMVAEARYEKHLSEKKVESAEQALKSAEEAIQLMQVQMQALQAEREQAEKKTQEMEMTMGKGKWIARRDSDVGSSLRLLNCHGPYHDFMAFIAHLRVLHPSSPNHTPAMSTLLQLPFLARLLTEDSEPTVRLDLAPSLNWLSRRSVLSAIHSGQLIIEPLSVGALFAESATQPASVAGVNSSNDNISCALCGVSIFPTAEPQHSPRPPIHPLSHTGHSQSQVSSTWSGSFFKRPLSTGNPPQSPTHSIQRSLSSHSDSQIFVFRLAQTASTGSTIASSLPIPSLARSTSQSGSTPMPISASQSYSGHGTPNSQSSPGNQTTTLYPLCMSGWCLNRLRTTCTMWAFIRTGIVDKIWEEELPPPPPPPSTNTLHVEKHAGAGEKPPIPPRKRGIWGIASAIGERAASWGDSDKDKKKAVAVAVAAAAETPAPVEHRRVPPPLPPVNPTRSSHAPPPPPPLPKRNEGRGRSATPQPKAPEEVVETNVPATVSSSTAATEAAGATATTGTPKPLSIQTPPSSSELPPVVAPLSPIRRSHLRNASSGTPPPPLPPRAVRSPPPAVASATPTSIPLPESRPDTPAGAAEPVSRTGSPAVAINSSAGGGGAPPPIPRRAAARAVRGAPGGSRPSTPANGDVTTNTSPTTAAAGAAVAASVNGDDKAAEETKKVEGGAETKDGKADVGQDVAGESGLGTVAKDGDKSVDEEPASASATSTAAETAAEKVVVGGEENKEEEAGKGTEQDQDKEKEIANQEAIPDRSSQASPSSSDVFVDALSPGQELADPVDASASASALSLDSVSVYAAAAAAPQSDETAYEAKENNTDKEAEGKKEEDDLHEAEVDDNDQATIAAPQTPVAGQHAGLHETDAPEQGAAALTSDKLPNGISTSTTDEHVASQINGISQADPAVHVNGVVEPTNDGTDAARTQTKEVEEEAGTSEEKAEEERRKKEQDEKDRARFVGDSTWEERTWKEVVRLREDMFWARIGGIRD
ncbi:hypothetical protein CPC08DRAFT_746974 [Agrocybe pediades]|nr:hypothetical protein CPC08DRAFT_746974 [Agrocybe pediades]